MWQKMESLMTTIRFEKDFVRMTLLASMTMLIFSVSPMWGGDKEKDEETLRNATTVLQAMLNDNNVPSSLLTKADCVMVLPDVKKFGFGIGGSGGRGPMSCRTGKDFRGKWSAPAMYSVGGVSVGLQVGGSSSDYVLLIMDQKGVDALLNGKTKLGSDATAAAGPSGATATDTSGNDILTYGRASGLFAGVSLGGASLEPDNDANKRLYGKDVSAGDVVIRNSVTSTAAGRDFISALNGKLSSGVN
jgi:SH3 domain-containing YSC84-like protein 1